MDPARISQTCIRAPSVMLIRIPAGTEPTGLRLSELPFAVLHVRHPLPACTRISVMRPAVVLVGRSVQPRDFDLVLSAAAGVGASVVLVDGLVDTTKLHDWVMTTVASVIAKRQQLEDAADAQPTQEPSFEPQLGRKSRKVQTGRSQADPFEREAG
jgi:hypothetical protein